MVRHPELEEGLSFDALMWLLMTANVVKIPLKVTLSEVCVLAVFLLHLSM